MDKQKGMNENAINFKLNAFEKTLMKLEHKTGQRKVDKNILGIDTTEVYIDPRLEDLDCSLSEEVDLSKMMMDKDEDV